MAVVTTTTVNRTRMTATTTTTGTVDDSVQDRPTTSGDKYVSMETILVALRRLVDRNNVDQVHEEDLAAEVQTTCPQWDCPKWSDAVQLVREYLREGSLQGLCSETGTKGCWRLERGSSFQSTPVGQTSLCPEHRSAPMNRGARKINGLTKEQVFRLVCRILREDGRKYNDVYCLCNKCLGAKNGKVSRCRLPPNSKKSKHGQKNMQLLKSHRRLTEKIVAEKSSSKKSRKSRSKSAKNRSTRYKERREDAQKKERSKSRKSSKSKSSSKKSGSKKSKSRSTSKKSKDQKKGKGNGDEIAEVDGASRNKNKRRMSKKAKKSGSKKSNGSDKNRSRSKKRQSKKRRSKKANKARV